jgi:hypothetical protein
MSTAVARNLVAEMKLLGMITSFDGLVTEATREQCSCTDFLDAMVQSESDLRTERKTKLRIKAAKLVLRQASKLRVHSQLLDLQNAEQGSL